jgi:hypothetical protein
LAVRLFYISSVKPSVDVGPFLKSKLFCIAVPGVWWLFLGTWCCVWMHSCLHTLQQGNAQAEAVVAKGNSDF